MQFPSYAILQTSTWVECFSSRLVSSDDGSAVASVGISPWVLHVGCWPSPYVYSPIPPCSRWRPLGMDDSHTSWAYQAPPTLSPWSGDGCRVSGERRVVVVVSAEGWRPALNSWPMSRHLGSGSDMPWPGNRTNCSSTLMANRGLWRETW